MTVDVLIIEPSAAGHRPTYVALLARHCGSRTAQVVTTAAASSTDSWKPVIESMVPVQAVATWKWNSFHRALAQWRPGRLVRPDADRELFVILLAALAHPKITFVPLIMRDPRIWRSDRSRIASVKAAAKTAAIAILRRLPNCEVVTLAPAFGGQVDPDKSVRDPVEFRTNPQEVNFLRADFDLTPDLFWTAVVGAIDTRKQPALAIEAMGLLSAQHALLVAGRVSAAAKTLITDASASCDLETRHLRIVDRFLSDAELDAAISAVDCILVIQTSEIPSGVVARAVCAGTPVVLAAPKGVHDVVLGAQSSDLVITATVTKESIAKALERARLMKSARKVTAADLNVGTFTSRLLGPDEASLK